MCDFCSRLSHFCQKFCQQWDVVVLLCPDCGCSMHVTCGTPIGDEHTSQPVRCPPCQSRAIPTSVSPTTVPPSTTSPSLGIRLLPPATGNDDRAALETQNENGKNSLLICLKTLSAYGAKQRFNICELLQTSQQYCSLSGKGEFTFSQHQHTMSTLDSNLNILSSVTPSETLSPLAEALSTPSSQLFHTNNLRVHDSVLSVDCIIPTLHDFRRLLLEYSEERGFTYRTSRDSKRHRPYGTLRFVCSCEGKPPPKPPNPSKKRRTTPSIRCGCKWLLRAIPLGHDDDKKVPVTDYLNLPQVSIRDTSRFIRLFNSCVRFQGDEDGGDSDSDNDVIPDVPLLDPPNDWKITLSALSHTGHEPSRSLLVHTRKRVGRPIDPVILRALWDVVAMGANVPQIRVWLQRKKLSHLASNAQQMLNLKLRVVRMAQQNNWAEVHDNDLQALIPDDELEDVFCGLLRLSMAAEGTNTVVKMVRSSNY